MGMASTATAAFFVLILTMGELTPLASAGGGSTGKLSPGGSAGGGSAGGEGELTAPGGSAGGKGSAGGEGELTAPGGGSAGGSAGGEGKLSPGGSAGGGSAGGEGELTAPGGSAGGKGSAGGEGELTAPGGSAGGGSSGGELMPPPSAGGIEGKLGSAGGTASELIPGSASTSTTTAGISALLQHELSLLDLGSTCSMDCVQCLFETIGSCLVVGLTCPDPVPIVECYIAKFIILKDCYGTGEMVSARGRTLGSAGGIASNKLMAGSSAGASVPAAATTEPAAGVSSLPLRYELALLDLGSNNCSDDCIQCLLDATGSCLVDGLICFDPWVLIPCLIDKFLIIEECFGTKRT